MALFFIGFILVPTIKEILLFLIFHQLVRRGFSTLKIFFWIPATDMFEIFFNKIIFISEVLTCSNSKSPGESLKHFFLTDLLEILPI